MEKSLEQLKKELEEVKKRVASEAAMAVAESGSGHDVRKVVRTALKESLEVRQAENNLLAFHIGKGRKS